MVLIIFTPTFFEALCLKNRVLFLFFQSHDYLYIEKDKGILVNFTGRIPPQTIMSSVDSDMTLRFTSDNRVTKLGVKIRIDYILDGNFCKIKKNMQETFKPFSEYFYTY